MQSFQFQGYSLSLNGQGSRTKFFTNVYTASLYLTKTSQSSDEILAADTVQLMRLDITSSMITKSLLTSSIKDGLKLSAGKDYKKYADLLDEVFQSTDLSVNEGDQFDFMYVPGEGTRIFHNQQLIKTIEGLGFKRVLFGIWIGDKPIQRDLKHKLLSPSKHAHSQAKQLDMA